MNSQENLSCTFANSGRFRRSHRPNARLVRRCLDGEDILCDKKAGSRSRKVESPFASTRSLPKSQKRLPIAPKSRVIVAPSSDPTEKNNKHPLQFTEANVHTKITEKDVRSKVLSRAKTRTKSENRSYSCQIIGQFHLPRRSCSVEKKTIFSSIEEPNNRVPSWVDGTSGERCEEIRSTTQQTQATLGCRLPKPPPQVLSNKETRHVVEGSSHCTSMSNSTNINDCMARRQRNNFRRRLYKVASERSLSQRNGWQELAHKPTSSFHSKIDNSFDEMKTDFSSTTGQVPVKKNCWLPTLPSQKSTRQQQPIVPRPPYLAVPLTNSNENHDTVETAAKNSFRRRLYRERTRSISRQRL